MIIGDVDVQATIPAERFELQSSVQDAIFSYHERRTDCDAFRKSQQ